MLATSTKSDGKSSGTQQGKEQVRTSITKSKATHSSEKQHRVRKNTQPYINNTNSPYAHSNMSNVSINQKEFRNSNYDSNSGSYSNNRSNKRNNNTAKNKLHDFDGVEFQYPTPLTSEVMTNVRLLSKPEEYIPIHEPTAFAANLALRTILSEKHEQHEHPKYSQQLKQFIEEREK